MRKRAWSGAVVHLLSAFLLAACATTPSIRTNVIGTWKADNYDKKLSDFLVIALADEPSIRSKVESLMAGKLEKAGLRAMASSDIMPADEEIKRATVEAAMGGKSFDGVLVSRLLGVDQSTTYVPPSPDITFENTFQRSAPIITTPGYVEHQSVLFVQIDLYDTASEHLVWSMKTQTLNLDTVTDFVNNLSDILVHELQTGDLIRA